MEKPTPTATSLSRFANAAAATTAASGISAVAGVGTAGASALPPSIKSIPTSSTSSSHLCLGWRVCADLLAAGGASLAVSPVICIIDKGIIENASGKSKMVESMKNSLVELVSRPHKFLMGKPFGLIYLLYFGTYFSANSIDTVVSTRAGSDPKIVTAGKEKFLVTSGVNMGLCLYKDQSFARIFGTISPRPLPLPSYLLFSARDTLTIFFSFNLPPMIAPYMPQDRKLLRPETYAQLFAPAVCQMFSTPLHLLGLDLYNRGGGVRWRSRWETVQRNWASSALARMGRIVPAFGFGGVTNTGIRRSLLERMNRRYQ